MLIMALKSESSPSSVHLMKRWNITLLPPELSTTSLSTRMSRPNRSAVDSASPTTALVAKARKLFTSLMVWPLPSAPVSMMVLA